MPLLQYKPLTGTPTDQLLEAQRQQALADIMTKQAMSPVQAPSGGTYQAKLGIGAALAPIAEAILAKGQQKKATTDMQGALPAYQNAPVQALADAIKAQSGGGVGPNLAPSSGAPSQPPVSTVTPGAGSAPIAAPVPQGSSDPSAAGPPPGAMPPQAGAAVAPPQMPPTAPPGAAPPQAGAGSPIGPNFLGALRALQSGVDPTIIGKILDSQAPAPEIKPLQQAGMSNQDIAAAISGKAGKDALMTVGQHDDVLDGSGHVVRAGQPNLPEGMYGADPATAAYNQNYLSGQTQLRQAGASNISMNTDRSLYGTMADKLGTQYADQYQAAQNAPEAIAGAQRVRDILKTVPYTGAGAGYKLALGKAARAAGINYAGDDLKNTEALVTEMAKATLAQVHTSGLGAGQGFSNADRTFLEKAAGGSPTLESDTIGRLADLNERAGRISMQRWNDTYSRLKPGLRDQLGLRKIEQPGNTPGQPVAGKLTRNPDGTLTYSR